MKTQMIRMIVVCSMASAALAYVCPEGQSGVCTKSNPNCATSSYSCSSCSYHCKTCYAPPSGYYSETYSWSTRSSYCLTCRNPEHEVLFDDSCGIPPAISATTTFVLIGVGVVLVIIIIAIYVSKRPKSEETPLPGQAQSPFAPSPGFAGQPQQMQGGFQPVNQAMF